MLARINDSGVLLFCSNPRPPQCYTFSMSSYEKWSIKKDYIPDEDSSRKHDLSRTKNNIAFYKEAEQKMPMAWAIQNSTLLSPLDKEYDHHSYEGTFQKLLPEGVNLKEFIENSLSERKGQAVGIDIGGLGSQVFKEFSPGFFERSAGVVLTDTRIEHKVDPREDAMRGHSVIEGDLFKQETRKKIMEWLAGEKADLIFERMQGGLTLIPRDSRLVIESLRALYSVLRDNGLMLLQTSYRNQGSMPYRLLPEMGIREWQEKIAGDPLTGLEVHIADRSMLIRKKENAPAELPYTDLLTRGSNLERFVSH